MPRHSTPLLTAALLLTTAPAALADGTTERVSVSSAERQANELSWNPQLSADGRYVSFVTFATNLIQPDANGPLADVLRRDRRRGVTIPMDVSSRGEQAEDGLAFAPGLSRNGRYAAFHSAASNLVPGDTNGKSCPGGPCGADVFFRDLATGRTERISTGPGGVEGDAGSFLGGFPQNGRMAYPVSSGRPTSGRWRARG